MTTPTLESDAPIRLAVIIGSVRAGRFGPTPAHWYTGSVAGREDVVVDTIDLLEADLSPPLNGNPDDPHDAAEPLRRRLGGADAFVAEGAATVLTDQLVWWGRALRDARARRPYGS